MKDVIKKHLSQDDYILAIIMIIFPVIFWGLSFISTKVVLEEMPPVSIAFFRQIIALVPLLTFLVYKKESFKISVKDLMLLAVSSFFGIVLYFVFENTGLELTTASNASMIVASLPVFTLITESLFYRMKVTVRIVIYIILSIIGVYLVISVNGKLDLSSSTFTGNTLIIGAMLSWVVYTILSRDLGIKYSSLLITTYQTAVSTFLFIPYIAHEFKDWKPLTPAAFLNLLYLGVFCSAVAYFLYLNAIKKVSATISSAFLNLIPVVTVGAGYFLLNEKLTLVQFAGMSLVITSIFKLGRK